MKVSTSIVSILAVLTITALSATAFAQLKANPVYGQRNLTNAKNTVEVIAGPLGNYGGGGLTIVDGEEIGLGFNLGAAYGVNNDLSIGAMVAPLTLTPAFAYGDPELFGKYRFLHGSFEAAGALSFKLPVNGGDFAMKVGVPLRNRGTFRFDIAPTVALTFGESISADLLVPINAFYNVQQDLFVGLVTGANFTGDFGIISVPVGLGAGYTIQAPEGPMLDLTATFGIGGLNVADGNTDFGTGWQAGLGASYHLYL